MSDTQAIAARLTAIAAELHLKLDRAGAEWSHGGTKGSEDCYPCSLIRAAISAETVRLTVERDEAEKWASNKEVWISRAEQAEQENARLTAEIDAAWFGIDHGFDIESRSELEKQSKTNGFKYGLAQAVHHMWKRNPKVQQAEQQRDAAHAALTQYGEHQNCPCLTHDIGELPCTCGLDAALAASAPQKECDHKFIDSNHCLKCGWKPPAPAQETERGR